jgi:hypothetical protein
MCRNIYDEIFVERKYDSNLVKGETRKRVVQTIITFSVNNCEETINCGLCWSQRDLLHRS